MSLFSILLCLLLLSCNNEDAAPVPQTSPAQTDAAMDSLAIAVQTARELLQKGQTDEALRMADALIKNHPGSLDALSIKADALKEKGQTTEALAVLEEAYALQPRDKETAYNLAYEYADAKSSRALALTDTLLKYDKTETVARAWYIKGHYHNRSGNTKEALTYFDSSVVANPNFSDAYYDKGLLLFQQKNYDGALKAFALGQKFDPANAVFYLWVAKTQEAMGNKTDAKANYERAFALDKELTEARAAADRL